MPFWPLLDSNRLVLAADGPNSVYFVYKTSDSIVLRLDGKVHIINIKFNIYITILQLQQITHPPYPFASPLSSHSYSCTLCHLLSSPSMRIICLLSFLCKLPSLSPYPSFSPYACYFLGRTIRPKQFVWKYKRPRAALLSPLARTMMAVLQCR